MTIKRKQFQRTEDGHLILMSNEERNLLITDLTARLNYGVICLIERVDDFGPIHRNEKLTGFCFDDIGGFYFEVCGGLDISFAEKIMPYLRPMSSMTEEEKEELLNLLFDKEAKYFYINGEGLIDGKTSSLMKEGLNYPAFCPINITLYTDWLNAHHFDYRGLIEKGLALEVTEENNPYKE